MKQNGMKWDGTEIPFHCLGILKSDGIMFHSIVWEMDGTEQVMTFLFQFYPYLKKTIII